MDQVESEIEIKLLYYIHQERQDNEIVEKIIWNNQNTELVDELIQNESKVQVIGLYGTIQSIQQYLELKTKCKVKIDQEIYKWQNRGILCWSNYQEIYYISFLALDTYFSMPKFQETPEITVYRFLRDLCHTIILLPSQGILENWKNTTSHYYQEQDTIVQDFQIMKLEEAELSIIPIHLQCNSLNKDQKLIFAPGQGNIRSEQLKKSDDSKQFEISEKLMSEIFLLLLKRQNYDIYSINLDKFSLQVQNIIREVSKDLQQKLEASFDKFYSKSYQSIQSDFFNKVGWGNRLKQNVNIFEMVHIQLFTQLRTKLQIQFLEQMDKQKIQDGLIQYFHGTDYKHEVNNNKKDLLKIIDEYQQEFKDLNYNKDFNLKQLFANYKNDILRKLKQLTQQKDMFIDLQLYEFRYMTQKDTNSDALTIIDYVRAEKISLTDIINPSQNSTIQILYYCQSATNKQTFLITSEELQGIGNQSQYIWIDAQQLKSQTIMKFNQEKFRQLIFHYELSNTTLFIFNTKIGITVIQYNEDRKLIISEKSVQSEEIFIDFSYLRYSECFILISKSLISQSLGLYKWEINNNQIQKLKLKAEFSDNQNRSLNYEKVMSQGNGNYFILANSEKCDIYNFNNQNVAQIKFIDYGIKYLSLKRLYLFFNEQDWFVCLNDDYHPVTVQIQNMSSQQKIVSKSEVKENYKYTNPYIDLVKGSVIKYGPTINLLKSVTVQTQLYAQEDICQKIEGYFNLVDFTSTDQLNSSENIYQIEGPQMKVSQFMFYIISRASIQLCTIEKQLLIPLCDGLRLNQSSENNVIRVLEKVEQIQFGILEKLLSYQNQKLFIVSIMGRQSSGKSYLLNRIFGTRFGVSSARCTDGIWLSISKIHDTVFVLFDCEGLFSSRRTPEDETMLLAFLSSISDITILNQDLTFSRNLNELFLNLSKSIEQIRGEKLFKGKLMIAVRDVNQKEKEGAQKELMRNIEAIKNNQQTGNFLSHLFNDQFQTILMSYFDTKQFDKDINELRKVFINGAINTNRWDDQKQLLRSMKIMLVQIEVKDHRSLEEHELDHTIQILKRKSNNLWCTLKQKKIEEIQFTDIQESFNNLFNLIQNQDLVENSTITNNLNLKKYNNLIQEILKQRQIEVLNMIDLDISNQTTLSNQDKLQRVKIEIKQLLIDQSNQYQICLEKCSECFLYCRQRKNHVQRDFVQQMNNLQEYLMQLRKEIDQNNERIQNKDDLETCKEQLEKYKHEQCVLEDQIQYKIILNQMDDEQNKVKQFFSTDSLNFENFNQQLIIYFKLEIDDMKVAQKYDFIMQLFEEDLKISNQLIQTFQQAILAYQDLRQQQLNKVKRLNYGDLNSEKQKLIQYIDRIQFQISSAQNKRQQIQSNIDRACIKLKEYKQQEIVIRYLDDKQYKFQELEQLFIHKQELKYKIQTITQQFNSETMYIKQEINQPEGISNYLEKQINKCEEIITNLDGELFKSNQKLGRLKKQVEENKKKEIKQSTINILKKNDEEIQNLQIIIDQYNEQRNLAQNKFDQWQEEYQNQLQTFNDPQQFKQNEFQDFLSDSNINVNENLNQSITISLIQSQDQTTTIQQLSQFQEDVSNSQISEPNNENLKEQLFENLEQQNKINSDQQFHQSQELFIQRAIVILFPNYQEEVSDLFQQIDQLDVTIQELQQLEDFKKSQQRQLMDTQEIMKLTQQIEKDNCELEDSRQKLIDCSEKINGRQREIDIINLEIEEIDKNIIVQQQQIQSNIEQQKIINSHIQKFNYITQIYENIQKLEETKQNIFACEEEIQINESLNELEEQLAQKQSQLLMLTEQIQLKQLVFEQQQQYGTKSQELENKQQFISKQHKCGRDNHYCDQICEGCKSSEIFCKEKAGHQELHDDYSNHLCDNPKHYCIKQCSVNNCHKQCQNQYNHNEDIKHDCLQKHKCLEICNFCSNSCDLNTTEYHDVHICSVKQCTKECYFGIHSFSEDKKCLNTCFKSHSEPHDDHICNNKNHSCQQECKQPGICQIGAYIEQIKTWKTKDGMSFNYKVYKQMASKIQCQSKFDLHQINHPGSHVCTEKHICDQRCPECDAYCTELFGHSGKHKPHLHRNKEQQIFTAVEGSEIKKLIIKEEGEEERQFSLGESCEPETCTRSCTRRSRAHFHLLECKGGDLCADKQMNKGKKVAKHQTNKYQGSDKIYDEVLCENFWDHLGWENPIEAKQRLEISLCNYYCNACGEKERKYCTKEAWHTDSNNYCDHNFSCKQTHNQLNGVDVQFVIDTTGSMGSYIEMVKQTVIRLMQATQPYFKDNPSGIQFSVVWYKDHCDPKVFDSINFSTHDRAVSFINSLKADGGGDYPEAMLDGLNEGAAKSWRSDTKKFQFLLADSPPHGVPKFHNQSDSYPKGCPCGLVEDKVLQKIQAQGIELIVLKLNENLNQTIVVFQKIMPSLVSLNNMSNEEFIKKIEQLVCKQLQIREITLKVGC